MSFEIGRSEYPNSFCSKINGLFVLRKSKDRWTSAGICLIYKTSGLGKIAESSDGI